MSEWGRDDWGEGRARPDWYGKVAPATVGSPVILNEFQSGSVTISAGIERCAWCVITAESETTTVPEFGTVTWGGQTVETLYNGVVTDSDPSQNRMFVGMLRETAIAVMDANPVSTTGTSPDTTVTGAYQLVEQTSPIPSSCSDEDNTEPFNPTITCPTSVVSADQEPIIVFGHSNRTGAVVSALPAEFATVLNVNAALQTTTVARRDPGNATSIAPFITWDLNAPKKLLYGFALQWSGNQIPFLSIYGGTVKPDMFRRWRM